MSLTIHILSGGYPLCRFSKDLPAQWPASHKWARSIADGANCVECERQRAAGSAPELLYYLKIFVHAHANENIVPPHLEAEARAAIEKAEGKK